MLKVALAVASGCFLVGCSTGANSASTKADIAKITNMKSNFGPDYKTSEIPERAIDPAFFSSQKLPDGLTFDPANCAKAAVPDVPADVQGNMSAITAEGNGNLFVIIALETSKELPFKDPGKDCSKVAFSGTGVRGGIETVDAPQIDGTRTQGVHRVLQAVVSGSAHTGELYSYSAQFGVYEVLVVANPQIVPGQVTMPKVDTQRARDLLVKAVAAVRG